MSHYTCLLCSLIFFFFFFFFFQAEDGIRDLTVTGVQTCALPILSRTTSLAPKKCLFFRSTMTWPCCQVSSTKGRLQTMLAASVHLSACFSTETRCAGRAAKWAARTGKYPRGASGGTYRCLSYYRRTHN